MTFAPPFRPQAVVFDLDGLLVDSEGAWEAAERRVVASFDRPWDGDVRRQLLGCGPEEAAVVLAEHLGGVDPDEVDRRILAAALEEMGAGVQPQPGALALLRGLAGRVPLAVATNSRRPLAEVAAASAGVTEWVDVLVTVEDVERAKPAPDVYLGACDRLGADPRRSIGLEDSAVGARAAAAAGLWVIGCPSEPGVTLDAAHVVVTSLEELDPLALLRTAA